MYKFLNELGTGKYSTIYKARDIEAGRNVAVKLIRGTVGDALLAKARLKAEAFNMALCQHPDILSVYSIWEDERGAYLAMELAENGTLAQQMNRRWDPLQAAKEIAILARIVDHVHQIGLIHRAISPTHVFFTGIGTIKLGGFELARMNTGNGFCPISSDLRDIGSILYHLLIGVPANDMVGNFASLEAILTTGTARLLPPSVPRELEAICIRCLTSCSNQQYLTAGGLADDIGKFLRGE